MSESIKVVKSTDFAIEIIKFARILQEEKKEYILSKQIMRSGTSIGANIREAEYAASKNDFINKLHIAIKEANETAYWLELLFKTEYVSESNYKKLNNDCQELMKILISIINSSKT